MRPGYTRWQIGLHWLTMLLIPLQYLTYASIERTHHAVHLGQAPSETDLLLHQVHVLSGIGIGALMGVRLLLRWFDRGPRPLRTGVQDRIAAGVHHALYAALIAQAATGFIASYLWFGTAVIHKPLAWVIFGLIAVHVAAALVHALSRDGVMARMLVPRDAPDKPSHGA